MGRPAFIRLLVLAAVLLTAAATPAPAQARGPFDKAIWGPLRVQDGTTSAFPTYRRLGVEVYQLQLSWRESAPSRPADPTNPADPAYRWPQEMDEAVREASRNGIRLAVMVKGTPGWANGGRAWNRIPDDPQDLARFFTAASRKYPSVRRWMVWGEPGRSVNFDPLPPDSPVAPRLYARMVDASYAALKRVSRRNVVIGGMTFTVGDVDPEDWVRWMRLPNGKPPRMDWWGHNPFSRRFPDLRKPASPGLRDISDLDTLSREIARAYRGRTVPKLWISEFTISTDRKNRAFDFYVSRPMQARWVTASFALARSMPNVRGMGWYSLYDESPTVRLSLTLGLMTWDGRPKPSFRAYQRLPK